MDTDILPICLSTASNKEGEQDFVVQYAGPPILAVLPSILNHNDLVDKYIVSSTWYFQPVQPPSLVRYARDAYSKSQFQRGAIVSYNDFCREGVSFVGGVGGEAWGVQFDKREGDW